VKVHIINNKRINMFASAIVPHPSG